MTRRTKRVGLIISLVAAMMVVSTSVVLGAGLTITSFTPGTGGAGDSVVITGSGFTGATSVKFGTAEATFTVNSDSKITTTVPATAPAKGKISVTTPVGRATCSTPFTRPVAAKPTITSFTPTTVSTGTSVVITGTHLAGASAVTFGGADAVFYVDSDAQITATVPASAPAKGRLSVTTPAGRATSAAQFTRPAKPTIASFSPATSGTGSAVVIMGTHLTGTTGVTFGTAAATFHVDSDSQITAIVPLTAPAKAKIKVTTPAGSVKSSTAWVKGDCQCTNGGGGTPGLITITPDHALTGRLVYIHGAGLSGATGVEFGGIPATWFSASDDTISVVVPIDARSGPVTVTAPGRSWRSEYFRVIQFSVTSLSPDHGPVGTQVVITGAGFTPATEVTFNGADAAFTVNSDTKITATVPVGATTGTVLVWILANGATPSPQVFTVTP